LIFFSYLPIYFICIFISRGILEIARRRCCDEQEVLLEITADVNDGDDDYILAIIVDAYMISYLTE